MPRLLRMPGYDVVPRGTKRREFMEEAFGIYRRAGRPTLKVMVERVDRDGDDLAGTASREMFRRVLTLGVVPTQWGTAETIFRTLCSLAGVDTNEPQWEDSFGNGDVDSRLEHFKLLWNEALDEGPVLVGTAPSDDPWATGPSGGFGASNDDEPPF